MPTAFLFGSKANGIEKVSRLKMYGSELRLDGYLVLKARVLSGSRWFVLSSVEISSTDRT